MGSRFSVQLEPFGTNTLQLTLAAEEEAFTALVSAIPYDSITDLAVALVTLSTADTTRTVRWNTEPVEYDLIVTRAHTDVTLSILRFPDTRRSHLLHEQVFVDTLAVTEAIRAFWRALRRLEQHPHRMCWPYAFPTTEVQQLAQWLTHHRLFDRT